ncbi:MAG: four helix bundle protein [Bacteroidales bacterium]|nr:MAG: four helix bundle protein [Bacteroidales bacterium]
MNNRYDLEERTFLFAKNVGVFLKTIEKNIVNNEYAKQLARSSGSVGANYIEANESLGEKDYILHLRISRKEAKESIFWLRLIKEVNPGKYDEITLELMNECTELKKILSSIINKALNAKH